MIRVSPHRQQGRYFALLAVLACLGVRAGAATPSADAFLMLPVEAREIALGQATVGLVSDATAFHRNPAGIGMVRSVDVAASYSRLYSGLASHQMLAAALPVSERLRIGAAWVRLGVNNIPVYPTLRTLTTPEEREVHAREGATGSFGYSQNAFFLTFASKRKMEVDLGWQYLTLPMDVPIGVTIKYLTVSAGDTISASGIGLDAGIQARFPMSKALDNRALGELSLGLTLANVGRTRLTWDTPTKRKDTQPMKALYGAAYEQPLHALRSSVLVMMSGSGGRTTWGVEYTFLDQLSLRVGKDAINETGISFGAGIGWRGLRLDYALQRHDLGATHRVSAHYQY